MITYIPLWVTMKNKQVTEYKLINTYGLSRSTIFKLRHNQNVTVATLNNLCNILECDIQDIIEYTKD